MLRRLIAVGVALTAIAIQPCFCAPGTQTPGPDGRPFMPPTNGFFQPPAAAMRGMPYRPPTAQPQQTSVRTAPNFTALTPTGDKVSLSNYHGNVIVLYFWASWYAPSTKPMPQLQHIADLFKGRNVTVIALCVLDDKTKADAWISKHKQYTFPILIDPVGRGKDPITSQFEVTLIPTTVVIGSGGAIRASVTGMPESSVISLVKSIAAPPRPVAKKRPSSVPFGATHHDPLKAGEMLVHGVVMEDSDSSGSFPLSAAWAVLPSGSIVVFPAARSKTVVIDLQTVLKIGDAQQSNTSLKQGMEIDVYGRDAGTGEPLTARLITAAP